MSQKTLEVIGVFWKGHQSYRSMYPFSGDIVVSETGSFFGIFTDHYGTSNVKGSFKKGMLEFYKKYVDSVSLPSAAKGEIYYLLRAGILMQGDPIVGGWKGIYKLPPAKDIYGEDVEEEYLMGQVALSIFPV